MDSLCSGSFVLTRSSGMSAAWQAMGATEAEAELLGDPDNKSYTECSSVDGVWSFKEVYPAVPKFSTTYRLRMGETTTYEKPFPMSMTLVKKDTRTMVLDGTFGGVKSHLETTYSPEGMSVVGDIEGLEYTTFWTRQEPEVCGMYLLEDNKSLVDFMVAAFEKERGEMETALAWCGWRWSEQGDRITHEEIFGNGTVKKTFRLGEEVDTTSPFTEGTEVSVITRDFPGTYTMVMKTTACVATWRWTVDSRGIRGTGTAGQHSCTYSYSRIPDIQGRWKLVTQLGVEAQLESLGLTGEARDKMAADHMPAFVDCKPLGDGRWNFKSGGHFPEMSFGFNGKEFGYTWGGEDVLETATWRPDMTGHVMVSRIGGRVLVTNTTVTKHFTISDMEYQGLPNSKATIIYTRA